ncbi:MAG: 4Fe-4S binding protein [Synergistaceae bacterium]|nr:4Fe-4S binding protein [Synergistaceae bacterium]MBR0221095.1 4Fe-4S binding protein [Synergistaceae bacterium]
MSLFVDCELEPTERNYTGVYDYCIKCGACVRRCPVQAISIKYLRNPKLCGEHAQHLRKEFNGGLCGKCLVKVPCKARNPKQNKL